MSLLQLNLTPSRKDLRWFAGLWWPAMCAGIGFVLIRKFHAPTAATYVWSAGGLLAILGLISPAIIRPFYLTLLRITFPIGFVVSQVVLAAMYFLVLTPIGYLLRLFHDPMERQLTSAASYWVSHPAVEISRYFRQL
jgi:hypothetical protein